MARPIYAGIFLLPTACAHAPSMLTPRGPNAVAIADAWWVMFWGALVILTLVTALALFAVRRRRTLRAPSANAFIAGGGLAFPIVALSALLVYAFTLETTLETDDRTVIIEVTGHQWWWEVRYPGEEPVVTANEIHLPAGRPVQLLLRSNDVIHSFWIPQLAGKQDMVPGHTKMLVLQADAPGAFRGQCAEFCGTQHAHMALWAYALPPREFDAWRRARVSPDKPLDAIGEQGREHFLAQRCTECHTVRGTTAKGRVGPDLTHVGSRRFLGAGVLRNEPGAIARWIREHQRLKPGNRMERFDHLAPAEIDAIAAYLEQLQ